MASNARHTTNELYTMIEGLREDVGEIKRHLVGNGQPGLLERTYRNEEQIKELNKFADFAKEHWWKLVGGALVAWVAGELTNFIDIVDTGARVAGG